MQSGSANAIVAIGQGSIVSPDRGSLDYGRLVGDAILESGTGISGAGKTRAAVFEQPSGEDMTHLISIAGGYIGLAVGLFVTGAMIIWQIP